MTAVDSCSMSRPGSHRLPLQYRKTPPESWRGRLRFRWSSPLDQDGVDFPGAMPNLLGTDLIIGNCARAWGLLIDVIVNIIVLVGIAIRVCAQIIIRCHCRHIML